MFYGETFFLIFALFIYLYLFLQPDLVPI